MKIIDKIYGEFMVDGVLEELISSGPVQRLKGVHQGGANYLVNKKWNVTRYEHSVGVMLLIQKLGGSLEEQIAGLLHDISHTAFSHVIDFVLENNKEDYHEKIYHSIITESDIPFILKKYGYDYKNILLDDSKWHILEQPAPELCADRVDYTLRDMYQYGSITLEEINNFLANLIIIDEKMYPKNIATAEWFVKTYYKEVIDFFMNPLNIYGNDRLANTIKLAIDKNVINLDTLLKTDEEVMNLLRLSDDKDVRDLLNQLHPNVNVKEDKTEYDLHRKNKVRLIDPSVLNENKLIRVSKLSDNVKRMNDEAKEKSEYGMYVKIISN
ncbi:HD domain-containing protein [Bacillus sp. RG28]|uniref:HD domain-containing protein n=1 Tax=Gottfriedia endophytica TaxID=2820819 RepID=A0A940NT54_9BACI|nr:HD domain-containing protein [Gottfriedia endophytica]MBP0726311.1 HD domain-containing protein [Gottfriedia endophytica]